MNPKTPPTLLCFLAFLTIFTACSKDPGDISKEYDLPDGQVYFETAPTDLSEMTSFDPMGQMNVFPRDHGGFTLKNPFRLPPDIPVYAVSDGIVVIAGRGTRQIDHPHAPQDVQGVQYDDWQIRILISSTVRVNYAHISKMNFELLPELEDFEADEMGHEIEIPVSAGDIIGWVGPHVSLDFSVTDYSLESNLINQSLYPEDQYYAADVYEYLREPLLSLMIAIASRTKPPWGGKADWDIPGKIIGNWFLKGTTSFIQFSRQLGIAYDHIEADYVTISDGSPMRDVPGLEGPGFPDVYWVRNNLPKPENVGIGSGMVLYELVLPSTHIQEEEKPTLGYMLVEMPEAGVLKLEIFKNETNPPTGFTGNVRDYVR